MKINILDPGLRDQAGHHYDYDLKLVRHYAQAGHDVHVYGFDEMEESVRRDFEAVAPLTPLLTAWPYRPPHASDSYAGKLVQYRSELASLAEELGEVREADMWIWPTILAQQLAACAARRVDVPIVGCVYWDPGVEARSLDAQLWRDALLRAHAANLDFTLASVEPELRHRFMPIVESRRFAVLPQPVDGPPIPEPKSALKRIGFFGHQREDKWSDMLVSLLSRLIEDGFKVTYQNSGKDVPAPDVPGIDLLGYVDNLAEPIAECDLIVLPYDVERYRAGGSGILVECLALGIPVTAPIGTLPGRTIERFGVGPLFAALEEEAIYQAISTAERDYATFAANAHQTALYFSEHHGVARFADALLAPARN